MQQTIERYRAGMPQLAYTGLSENWLIKECGHRHWEALAGDAGRRAPDFVDDDGSKSYAAFTAIRLTGATLHAIGENDDFELGTGLCRTGPARHFSRHRLLSRNGECAIVSMSSTFVRRHEVRNNRSVTRARFAAMGGPTPTPPADAVDMARRGKQFRAGQWDERLPFTRADRAGSDWIEFLPCPNNDFNGADFLYFASFQSFVDRAEWQRHRFHEPPVIAGRELFFYGNINVGDTLGLRVVAEQKDEHGLVHWCELRRGSDQQKIADVVTNKHWRQR
ncbi:Pnap_2097 family protein [Paraburkholderia strydomiana]|uniref:Pnap_2097 family protein n=1 Tax=Paraburkholderia strydomiana TaxID=1245417 RepID=UPI0038B7813E